MVSQLLPHFKSSDNEGQSAIYKRTQVEQCTTHHEFIYDSSKDNQINERYESWANPLLNSQKTNAYRSVANVDSDIEFEEAAVSNYQSYFKNTQSEFTSLISKWFYTILHLCSFGRFKKQEFSTTRHYYYRYEDTKWNKLQRHIDITMQYMYLLLVKVVLLDSWLLSRASRIRERAVGRRTKIFWLLLSLFLATDAYIAHKHSFTCLDYLRNIYKRIKEIINNINVSIINH